MDIWRLFNQTIENEHLVAPGDTILLSVSGGPDSVCLSHLFWRLRKIYPVELAIVCFDHGLRKDSKKEAAFVHALGKRWAIPVTTCTIPVEKHAAQQKVSTEAAGRDLRYDKLTKFARNLGCTKIATGHTAD